MTISEKDIKQIRSLSVNGKIADIVLNCLRGNMPHSSIFNLFKILTSNPNNGYIAKNQSGVYFVKLAPDIFADLKLSSIKMGQEMLRKGRVGKGATLIKFSGNQTDFWKDVSENAAIKSIDYITDEKINFTYFRDSSRGIYMVYHPDADKILGITVQVPVQQDKNIVSNPAHAVAMVMLRIDEIAKLAEDQSLDIKTTLVKNLGKSIKLRLLEYVGKNVNALRNFGVSDDISYNL